MSTRDSVPLKELRCDILSHFLDDLNYGLSVGKPKKNNGLLGKKKHQRGDSKTKRNKWIEK